MNTAIKMAIYLRVSSVLGEIANQRLDLLKYASARGWEVVQEYADVGISGTRARRPGLDKLMEDARKRKFDGILVWRFDRFARSVKHLVDALTEFDETGLLFVSFSESIDLSTAMGKAMFAIVAAIGQLERDLIRERIMAGLRRVKAEGRKLGRPAKDVDIAKALELRASGMKLRLIATTLGLSKSRVAAAIKKAGDPLKGT